LEKAARSAAMTVSLTPGFLRASTWRKPVLRTCILSEEADGGIHTSAGVSKWKLRGRTPTTR
jgi:hypothetical protein